MASHTTAEQKSAEQKLNDPDILRRVQDLRQTDNVRGWFYLVREYLFLAAVIGGAIAFYHWLWAEGLSLWWMLPVCLVANVLVGAGQHRLVTLTHEAAHYMLFRNRLLNEFVSEWFCMFPVLGVTHKYRIQHLGHHQFPNDPERDPDWAQLRLSGHRFNFPMTRWQFLWHCVLKQMLLIHLPIRYIFVRARFDGANEDSGPYSLKRKRPKLMSILAALYFTGVAAAAAWCVWTNNTSLLVWIPLGAWLGVAVVYLLAPARFFTQYVIQSDLSPRVQALMHVTYYSMMISALAWLTLWTGQPWWLFYLVFWIVPLGTSFAYFMILRQLVQHGNAPRDRLTNTRVFHVAWPISMAVFPIGNDYHLPHHLFPMVPHYNLRKLHQLLMETREYEEQVTLVEGYFIHTKPPRNPTVVDVMTHAQV